MAQYKIPVTWENYGIMEIEADSLDEACKLALGSEPLPEGEYIMDSCELDLDVILAENPNEKISEDTLSKQNLL